MVVVCFNEENVHTFKDVIAYDVLTMDDVKEILKEKGITKELNRLQIDKIKFRLGKFEHFPDMEDLRKVIEEVM